MPNIVYDVREQNTKKAFNFSVKQLIAQKMKKPYNPDKYFDFSFINKTMKIIRNGSLTLRNKFKRPFGMDLADETVVPSASDNRSTWK